MHHNADVLSRIPHLANDQCDSGSNLGERDSVDSAAILQITTTAPQIT